MSQQKTSSNNPRDWIRFAEAELDALHLLTKHRTAYLMCRSKLAEVLEKLIKAELIHLGWTLVRTHDLQVLVDELIARSSSNSETIQPLAEEFVELYIVGRYPGFDLEDSEDWTKFEEYLSVVTGYAHSIKRLIQQT